MREIGKLYRLEGQLIRSGLGYCLRREPNGPIWKLTITGDASDFLNQTVCVEGIKSASQTLDVSWIARLDHDPDPRISSGTPR